MSHLQKPVRGIPQQYIPSEKNRRLLRLAKVIFGATRNQVINTGIELYEKKFKVLETARRFMEDGTLKILTEDSFEDTEAARITMMKQKHDNGEKMSFWENPIKPLTSKEMEDLMKESD